MDDYILLEPTHPGELLWFEFLEPMGLSANALAIAIRVPANRIQAIVKGRRAISADTALRLSRYFGLSEEYWMRAQFRYDLQVARRTLADELTLIRPRSPAAETA